MTHKSHLRSRIALFVLAPGVVCALLIGIYLTYALTRDISQYEKQMGNAYSEQIAVQAFTALQAGDTVALEKTAQLALEYPLLRAITFYDSRQQEIAHAGPRHQSFPDGIDSSAAFSSQKTEITATEYRQLIVPVTEPRLNISLGRPEAAGHPPSAGWLRVEFSNSFMMLHKYRTILVDIIIVTAVLACAFWLAMPFSDRLSETLRSLARHARATGGNERKLILPTSNIIELHDLGQAIGDMQSAVAEQQANLQQHIEQSTQDLRETLETIEIQNIELDLARREAVQASKIKSEFLANTSHEIRTPLNSILGFSKLLLKTPLSLQQQDYLQSIRKSSENLMTIINDVLDLSKIEAGKLVLDYVAFDLNETLEEILQILAPGAHEKGLELLHMIYSDVPRNLLGDPLRLKQVLTNLISNAIKFSEQGNIIVRISTENTDAQQALLKIEVSDSGKGLPNDNNMIFKAFTQLDSSSTREYAGTGLGLAISRKIVEQMGGDIGYHSEPANTTFWFTVRLDIASGEQRDNKPPQLQGRHILVFDKERLCRLAISHSLTDWGIQPVLADSIEQIPAALEHYAGSEHRIDALILGLPVQSSHQQFETLLHSAQQLQQQYHCPALLCIPTSIRQSVAEDSELPVTILPKPVTESRLLQSICHALEIETHPHGEEKHSGLAQAQRDSLLVLAVDDNASNLKLISTILRDMGAMVLQATNGEEAVQAFRDHDNISIVFMDIQMPVMDGIDATRKIRQLETGRDRHTPVIALTAHALAEQRQQLLMSGLDDYLSKPISEQQLQRMIEKWQQPAIPEKTRIEPAARNPVRTIRMERCIDRSAALQACGNKVEVAIEMLEMLLATLETDRDCIMAALDSHDLALAETHIHKLHGACCYCGVTELKNCCSAMETLIKKGMTEHLPDVLVRFNAAVDALLSWKQQQTPAGFLQAQEGP